MSLEGSSLGLQWKLTALLLLASLLGSGVTLGGYLAGTRLFDLTPPAALAVGAGASLLIGLAATAVVFGLSRRMKLRLWDMGDMAGRIARGDFAARVEVSEPDEIGWLGEQLNEMASHLQTAAGELTSLAEQNRLLAEEARRGAALEERTKLARDLHDTVNQQLFVLAMRTAAARKRLDKLGGDAAGALVPELAALEELARAAHAETRGLIMQLRPTTLDQQGLGPALAEYARTQSAKEGWEIISEIDQTIRLDGAVGANLFRVAQEALNNISKHASARTVWVKLDRTEAGILLRLRDDGEGFDLKVGVRPTAVGLVGMQERVAAMGGTLRVHSSPGEGTEISVVLPLPKGGAPA